MGIDDNSMQSFATAIANGALPQLEYLDLAENNISDAGMQSFATAIANGALPQLQELHLRLNQIGNPGMQAFAAACGNGALPALKKLYFDRYKISDRLGHFLKEICKTRGIGGSPDFL